ncbi:MAG: hypothetical protein KDA31_11550 [Phycisphaerales bacterium]|nr:hypothetical protein [Phycisphaerales bacterium]MCB9836164.1 hypothetical protein [Phycisphaera sp.]
MTQEQLRDGLLGIAAPGAIGALGAFIGFWVSSYLTRRDEQSKLARRVERLGPTLGFGLAFVLVLWAIQGLPPEWNPVRMSASHRQFLLVVLGLVLVSVEALSLRATKQPVFRWAGRFVLVGLVLWLQLASARQHQWDAGVESIAWTAGFGFWMVLAFGAMDLLNRKATTTPAGLSMAAIPMCSIPAIFDSGASAQWQIAVGVGMALIGMAFVGLMLRGRSLGSPVGTLFVLWLSGVIVVGHFYSEMPRWHAGVLAAMPFLLVLPELKGKLSWKAKLAVRIALVALAGGVISFKAVPVFVDSFTGGGASELDFYK